MRGSASKGAGLDFRPRRNGRPDDRDVVGLLEGAVQCGLVGLQRADITVVAHRSGGRLEIGLGSASVYQSEPVLPTRTAETSRELVTRLSDDPTRAFLAALRPVTATGHIEHDQTPCTSTARTSSTTTAGDTPVDVSSKATDLSDAARDRFLEAVIRVKHQTARVVPPPSLARRWSRRGGEAPTGFVGQLLVFQEVLAWRRPRTVSAFVTTA